MNIAPLQLEQLFLGKLSITPHRGHLAGPGTLKVDVGSQFQRDADPSLWTVQITAKFGSGNDQPIGYEGEIEMMGRFRVIAKNLKEEEHRKLVAVNALSILYSSARETVAMLTSHGQFGKMLLPSVSFADQHLFGPGEQPPTDQTASPEPAKAQSHERARAKTAKS
jgi:preprotein translocase subunit SecB